MDDWQDAFIKEINKKAKLQECMFCGGKSLTVFKTPVTVVSAVGGDMKVAKNLPQAMLICEDCGYTSYFTLKHLGIQT